VGHVELMKAGGWWR